MLILSSWLLSEMVSRERLSRLDFLELRLILTKSSLDNDRVTDCPCGSGHS